MIETKDSKNEIIIITPRFALTEFENIKNFENIDKNEKSGNCNFISDEIDYLKEDKEKRVHIYPGFELK